MTDQTPICEVDFATVKWVSRKLDTRIRNGLQRAGIMTLGQLCEHSAADLRRDAQGVGTICIEAIKQKLKSLKLQLNKLNI